MLSTFEAQLLIWNAAIPSADHMPTRGKAKNDAWFVAATIQADSYNALMSYMQLNILLTFEVCGQPNDLSLLHPRNHSRAMQLMWNLRLACMGGGSMSAHVAEDAERETEDLMCLRYCADVAEGQRWPV